jgi:hypothetical protein
MAEETTQPEKKLIIDEDWKSQVEAEKEAAREKDAAKASPQKQTPAGGPHTPLPPPTLTFLISTLYLQGAIALGLLPNPITKKHEAQFDQAKHSIDMLAMLQQKTEGNRTAEESEELEGALHELRLAYVTVQQNS